jgi:hypothetical protein
VTRLDRTAGPDGPANALDRVPGVSDSWESTLAEVDAWLCGREWRRDGDGVWVWPETEDKSVWARPTVIRADAGTGRFVCLFSAPKKKITAASADVRGLSPVDKKKVRALARVGAWLVDTPDELTAEEILDEEEIELIEDWSWPEPDEPPPQP